MDFPQNECWPTIWIQNNWNFHLLFTCKFCLYFWSCLYSFGFELELFCCLSFLPQKWATGHQILLRFLTTQRILCGNCCKFKILKLKLCYFCLIIYIPGCLILFSILCCLEYSVIKNNLAKVLPNSLNLVHNAFYLFPSLHLCILILCGISRTISKVIISRTDFS